MKTRFTCAVPKLTTLALLAFISTHAQAWQSESILLPDPDPTLAPAGTGGALLIDPFNSAQGASLFLGVNTYTVGLPSILRLTPTDSTLSSYTMASVDSALTFARGLAYNPGDGLYAAGYGPVDRKAKNVTYIWTVRKSNDQGKPGTWTDDDRFALGQNAYSTARGIAVDEQGNVFVAGVARDTRFSATHWIVRRKVPGKAWATVFDAKNDNVNMAPSICYFPGNTINPTPAIFTTSDLNSKWTVMRSQQAGASGTWHEVDSWTGGGAEAAAYNITFDRVSGALYVVGCRGLNGKNPSAWVIRMSMDGGNSWDTLLDVAGAGSWASLAAIDGTGNVTVSGVINPTGSKPLWKTIRSTEPHSPDSWAASFADPDTLPFGDSTWSKGSAVVADAFGNVFATGMVSNWIDTSVSPPPTYSGERVGLLRLTP
ncbi:MAG: SBBP repeat-containing protein [Verrucomicrobiia bacterium]